MQDLKPIAAQIVELPNDELYFLIVDGVVAGAGPLEDDQRRFIGKAWFDAQVNRLRTKICESEIAKQRSKAGDISAVLALAEVLASDPAIGHTAVAAAMAVLILRLGLDRLCAGETGE